MCDEQREGTASGSNKRIKMPANQRPCNGISSWMMKRTRSTWFLLDRLKELLACSDILSVPSKFDRRWLCNVDSCFLSVFVLIPLQLYFETAVTWRRWHFFVVFKTPAFLVGSFIDWNVSLVPRVFSCSKLWLPASLIVFLNSFF